MSDTQFGAVERLVEFGLSAAVAQRMVASMNSALDAMAMPGRQLDATGSGPSFWIVFEGKPAGPFQPAQLTQLILDGKLSKSTHVWRAGMVRWQAVEDTPEVLRLIALVPPPFNLEN